MNDALFGALVGGGATCLAAWITIREQGRHVTEELTQGRFTDAYVTLQIYVSSWADHATWNLNLVRLLGETEPVLPQVSDVQGARVSLFASDEVVVEMGKFAQSVMNYRLAVGHLQEVRRASSMTGPAHPDLKEALDQLYSSARELVANAGRFHQLLRNDLRGARCRSAIARWRPGRFHPNPQ
ncbi:MAG: hypothetical protein HKL85_11465 [Acidimicrobiaceae bacterium]|nr:hypothetical protein [Acidimicrobiaceae bacterium]